MPIQVPPPFHTPGSCSELLEFAVMSSLSSLTLPFAIAFSVTLTWQPASTHPRYLFLLPPPFYLYRVPCKLLVPLALISRTAQSCSVTEQAASSCSCVLQFFMDVLGPVLSDFHLFLVCLGLVLGSIGLCADPVLDHDISLCPGLSFFPETAATIYLPAWFVRKS